jgi:hypothetical protein
MTNHGVCIVDADNDFEGQSDYEIVECLADWHPVFDPIANILRNPNKTMADKIALSGFIPDLYKKIESLWDGSGITTLKH